MNARLKTISVLLLMLVSGWAVAQASFPSKPLRWVIGSFAGGGNDVVGRILAAKLSQQFGQNVIVDNRGGANGIIGMGLVAQAAPDGYTFYQGTAGHLSVNPSLHRTMPFNIARDFAPLTQTVSLPFLLYLYPSVPIATLGEFFAYAKANPGKLVWSSSGNGGLPHLTGELLKLQTGIDTRRIAYKGSAPAFIDLLAGRVQYMIDAVSIGLPYVRTHKLRALATTGPKRLAFLPDVPALNETLPNFVVLNWYGMVLPAGTPQALLDRLHAEIVKAMNDPTVHEKLVALGFDPVGSTPKAFAAFRNSEQTRWAGVIRDAHVPTQ